MKVEYFAGGKRTVDADEIAVMQSNSNGGFAIFSPKPKSRYEGTFFRNLNVYKAVENLEVAGKIVKITHTPTQSTREYDNGLMETIAMPDGYDALIYKLNKQTDVGLLLDCREIFDNKQWGRTYSLSVEHKCLVITFTKKNDSREPNGKEYQVFVAVFGEGMQYLPVQQWVEHHYSIDQQRNSWPYSRYVFNAAKMRIKEAVIAFANDRSKAIETAINVYASRDKLLAAKEKRLAALTPKLRNADLNVSHALAVAALDALRMGHAQHYAGAPWFVQPWTRDELISVGAHIAIDNYGTVKNVLKHLLEDVKGATLSRFPRLPKELIAADGMGWLFFQLEQFITALEADRKLKTYVTSSELDAAEDKLDTALNAIFKERMQDGLVVNGPEETWMDTSFGGDKRDGARIEIQALTLAMLRLHKRLTGNEDPREKTLKMNVRKHFFTGKTLKDGKEDPNIRPNCFLASFLYPELLTKNEWEACFDTALKKLWLDWGGLTTIAKDNILFCNDHSGENPKSYHRGDSWFWVNNIAAIVMARVNRKKYSSYINKILKASMHEQQAMGIAGACGELSSASQLKSQGCWSQLWSNATLIELLREL